MLVVWWCIYWKKKCSAFQPNGSLCDISCWFFFVLVWCMCYLARTYSWRHQFIGRKMLSFSSLGILVTNLITVFCLGCLSDRASNLILFVTFQLAWTERNITKKENYSVALNLYSFTEHDWLLHSWNRTSLFWTGYVKHYWWLFDAGGLGANIKWQ